jgi:ribonuclease HIII
MNTYTKALTTYTIDRLEKMLGQYKVNSKSNPHVLYLYKYKGFTITIYKNLKLLIQGEDAESFGKDLVNLKIGSTKATKRVGKSFIGADEVGVGDYFGGLITCAAYVEASDEAKLKLLGVRDSKQLTDDQMCEIFNRIKSMVKYSCLVYSPKQYNDAVKKYQNTHIVKTLMHDLTIKKLVDQYKIDAPIVLDQYVDEKNYYAYFDAIKTEPIKIDIFTTKAENKYISVAVASIIARVAFLEQIKNIKAEIKMNFPLGSSDKTIINFARKLYLEGGIEKLYKYVKIDFKTTEKVIA